MKLTMTLPDHTENEAKELAEETFGAMMWSRREDGALVAYPNDNESPVVIEHGHDNTDKCRDALNQIFEWWDKKDGHLITHFRNAVAHKMEAFRPTPNTAVSNAEPSTPPQPRNR
jgi:hypothetical protein